MLYIITSSVYSSDLVLASSSWSQGTSTTLVCGLGLGGVSAQSRSWSCTVVLFTCDVLLDERM